MLYSCTHKATVGVKGLNDDGDVWISFEKMISGMYLGELVRLVILQCIDAKLLFDGKASAELRTRGRFYTKYITDIAAWVSDRLLVLADRTNGHAIGTVLRPSVVCL